jgi:hypothetical protein
MQLMLNAIGWSAGRELRPILGAEEGMVDLRLMILD